MNNGDNMVSIIVPVLNEEKGIERLMLQLTSLEGAKEIIVADGGSNDRTVEIASKYGRVIRCKKGRALQMNMGAREAAGDILWFVHSDSVVDNNSIKEIESAVNHGYTWGAFSMHFYDNPGLFMKYVSLTSNLRAKYLGLCFGDQGVFVEKKAFWSIGGYPGIELMEDWELSVRLKRAGKNKILDTPIGTSARRFIRGGAFRTFLFMQKIKILYLLGTPPSELAKIYREER